MIALAVFLPIISDMSGCSGNQAVAVSMRELSLGVVKPFEVLHVAAKEIDGRDDQRPRPRRADRSGGPVLEGQSLPRRWWSARRSRSTRWSRCSIGGTVPLLLRRRGMDPALASGPILTTVTDMCGFFLTLSLASLLIERLAG